MTEVLFYHLQNMSLESVLPPLLEKSLERGWRVVVQSDLAGTHRGARRASVEPTATIRFCRMPIWRPATRRTSPLSSRSPTTTRTGPMSDS